MTRLAIADEPPAGILDNSFLIEEAFNRVQALMESDLRTAVQRSRTCPTNCRSSGDETPARTALTNGRDVGDVAQTASRTVFEI